MRILYVTRHFNHSGRVILERLIKEGFHIAAVLLHEDDDPWRHPWAGLRRRLWYRLKCAYYRCPPIRNTISEERIARRQGLPIIYADSIKSDRFYADLQALDPDIIVLGGGWHELLPERVYNYPRLGCINTHPSLLPMFRGTSITRWQVLHGVEGSGSTIHYVDDRFDTGGALAQKRIGVRSDWSPQRLFLELGRVGADIMVPLLRAFEREGRQVPFNVDHDPTYYRYFKRWTWSVDRLAIDWAKPLREVHYFILACTQESYEYLGPHTTIGGKRFILRTSRLREVTPAMAACSGRQEGLVVVARDRHGLTVHRRGEPVALELGISQIFDAAYARRRGRPLSRMVPLDVGHTFTPIMERQ
jgi:methionyl-tRNA formyltransferase